MKAVVHIGMPKTGSTSIQVWLKKNQRELGRRGVIYDQLNIPGSKPGIAHQGIFISMKDMVGNMTDNKTLKVNFGMHSVKEQHALANTFREHFKSFLDAAKGDVIALSSEFLGAGPNNTEEISVLDKWLKPLFDEVQYLVYFRRQEEWLPSSYSQRIKRGIDKSLEEVLQDRVSQDWHAKARAWSDVVGRERMNVRLLETDFLIKGDLLTDYAQQLGINLEGLETPQRQNETLSAPAAMILREINASLPKLDVSRKKRNPLRSSILKIILADETAEMPRIKLTPEQVAFVRKTNAASNERLRQEFFPERPELFPPRQSIQPDIVSAEHVAKLAASLLINLQKAQGVSKLGRAVLKVIQN